MALMIQIKEENMVISQNLVLDLMQEKYYFIWMMVHHFLMTYLILEQGQAESFLKYIMTTKLSKLKNSI